MLLSLAVVCLAAVSLPRGTPPSGRITLAWDYPTNELGMDLTFRVYRSGDLRNWTLLTNVVGTNATVAVQVQPGQHFFAMTASNFWGESDFSAVASTPPLPRSDSKVSITRAD